MVMLFSTTTVIAKTINLYAEPKTDSKVTGVVNTDAGVTIVYTPKSGEWIKVANPNNGDVGWIKSSGLDANGYNMRLFTSGNGTHNYSFYQLGSGHSQFSQKQIENNMRNFEKQQRMMQMHMAHMVNDMFYFPHPVFVPIVLMPEQHKMQKTSSVKEPHITQTVQKTQVNKS